MPDAREPCRTVVDQLAALPTHALLLDEQWMLANITRPHSLIHEIRALQINGGAKQRFFE
jgi:hypothetical protein